MARQGNAGNGEERRQSDARPGHPSSGSPDQARRSGTVRRSVSPAVYRRRRLVLALFALVVVGVLILTAAAISRLTRGNGTPVAVATSTSASSPSGDRTPPGSSDPASAPTSPGPVASQAESPSAGPSASPSAADAAACDPSSIRVTAKVDQQSFAASENPTLTMEVTNTGTRACDINLGTTQMEFLISSGSDRVFSSRDCQVDSADLTKKVPPGGSETANFVWERNRTVPGCGNVGAAPAGGGATYVFTAKLGSLSSNEAAFTLK